MSKEFHELLTRIDERTQHIESRQIEEIGERHKLEDRVDSLEGWRNFYGGGMAALGGLFSLLWSRRNGP